MGDGEGNGGSRSLCETHLEVVDGVDGSFFQRTSDS